MWLTSYMRYKLASKNAYKNDVSTQTIFNDECMNLIVGYINNNISSFKAFANITKKIDMHTNASKQCCSKKNFLKSENERISHGNKQSDDGICSNTRSNTNMSKLKEPQRNKVTRPCFTSESQQKNTKYMDELKFVLKQRSISHSVALDLKNY